MKSIRLDYAKRCADDAGKTHNRWHHAIPPAIEVEPGEEIELDTRDAFDGQITPSTVARDLSGADLAVVRIPDCSFLGTIGVAPSADLRREVLHREEELLKRGGFVLPPDARGAVPSREPFASEGLRTIPPRENGGNLDIKQLSAGAHLFLPVFVDGALFSVGDAHFAQGDGEACGTAI